VNRPLRALPLLLLLSACGETPAPSIPPARVTQPPRVPDSLALRTRDGVEVWFTDSRTAADSAGVPCLERVMEIRRDTMVVHIPLLYTGQHPRQVNDSTIEVPIWLHCRPGNTYRVNLRTGQPTRFR